MTERDSTPRYDTCGARTRNGGTCARPAGWGTTHPGAGSCKLHGGSTPNGRTAGAREAEQKRARSILERLENPEPIEHPVYELLKLAAETTAWQRILRERMSDLQDLTQNDRLDVDRERALVGLYVKAQEQNAKLLVDMAKLDLKARALDLERERAHQVITAVSQALKQAGLQDHELTVRQHLANLLRASDQPQTNTEHTHNSPRNPGKNGQGTGTSGAGVAVPQHQLPAPI